MSLPASSRSLALAQLGLPVEDPTRLLVPPAPPRPARPRHLSRFDDLIRTHAEPTGLDWRLVAALIYEESRFNPEARSRSGAVGLMQVMPRAVRKTPESLLDPSANVAAGLHLLESAYRNFAYLDSLDRLRFTLAVYNAGFGHVNDARRIALEKGLDPNRWEGSVAETLPLLADPRWAAVVQHGAYRGGDTVHFVAETLATFDSYCRRVPRGPLPTVAEADDASPVGS
jgi:membrane-bound lytic murein transglycosylase F